LFVFFIACLLACLSVCFQFVFLLTCLPVCLYVCLFACLLVCLFIFLLSCLFYLFVCFLVCLFVCLFAWLIDSLIVCFCLFPCLLVCLFVRLFDTQLIILLLSVSVPPIRHFSLFLSLSIRTWTNALETGTDRRIRHSKNDKLTRPRNHVASWGITVRKNVMCSRNLFLLEPASVRPSARPSCAGEGRVHRPTARSDDHEPPPPPSHETDAVWTSV
jgi:hypothetical protein